MAKNKDTKSAEVLEQPIVESKKKESGFNTENFLRKNQVILVYLVGGLFLVIAGYFGYKYYGNMGNDEAQKEMFIAVDYFEADSLDKALNGDKVNRGLLDIADEYSGTDAGKLANFYIGVAYMKKGKFEDAISYLEKFNPGDLLIQARTYSLIGDSYLELKDYDNAIKFYEKASVYEANEYFTPRYLLKLGTAYEANKDYKGAAQAYDKIVTEFYKSAEFNDARKYKARAEELAKN